MAATHAAGASGESGNGGFNAKMPVTKLGRVSMWLALAFVVMFIINMPLVGVFGQTGNATLNEFSRTYLPYYGISMFAFGFAGGVVGLVAIFKQKERSLLTLLTVLPMLFVIVFLIGEFAFPH